MKQILLSILLFCFSFANAQEEKRTLDTFEIQQKVGNFFTVFETLPSYGLSLKDKKIKTYEIVYQTEKTLGNLIYQNEFIGKHYIITKIIFIQTNTLKIYTSEVIFKDSNTLKLIKANVYLTYDKQNKLNFESIEYIDILD